MLRSYGMHAYTGRSVERRLSTLIECAEILTHAGIARAVVIQLVARIAFAIVAVRTIHAVAVGTARHVRTVIVICKPLPVRDCDCRYISSIKC